MELGVSLMIWAGILLMLLNIIGYIRYERYVIKQGIWGTHHEVLYIPIILLILFFLGYIGVELFGKPDILIASILFGGSVFVLAMLGLLWSVTKRIQENDRLKSELDAAEKASQSKTVFLSSMSHDIRTPLNAIIGYANLSKGQNITEDELRSFMTGIENSARQLQELIDDVLEMSRIESGKIVLDKSPEDLNAIASDIRDIFKIQMQEKKMEFSVDLKDIEHRYVMCDRALLERVLMNLVSNSYKYTKEGGRVKVEIREEGSSGDGSNTYVLTVSDNGIGMTREFADKVFEAFEREQTSTVSGIQGTGLGMAITKNIVEIMNGDIALITSPGQGTEISVTLDLEPCERNEVDSVGHADDRDRIDFSGMKVLLVDDVEVNREIASMLLENMGFVVDTAVDGKQAYERIAESRPGDYDLVLMDVQMPVMNGYEASRKIRAIEDPYLSGIPIIALTANAFEEDVNHAAEAGMNGHIAKPIDPDQMMNKLSEIVGQK